MEIWKEIKGFEGRFKISNHGRVLSINGRYNGEKILAPAIHSTGYYGTNLRNKKSNRRVKIHTLVAESFIGEKPNGKRITVNHKDGNKLNNHVDNLEWIEAKENCEHAWKTGLINNRGENNKRSKLKAIHAHAIKYKMIGFSNSQLSNIFNISSRQIRDIKNNNGWNHIAPDYKPSSVISNSLGS